MLYLNNHIKTLEDSKVKEQLIKRKYLLLATGTLPEIEEYYLDQGTLDNLTLPPFRKEGLRKTSFNFLVYNFSELISNINIPNINMTIEAEEKAIISLLLIKCYIDLSINEEIKQKLTDQLTDPNLYKNLNFSIITKLIDNIIFSNETRDYPSTIKQ